MGDHGVVVVSPKRVRAGRQRSGDLEWLDERAVPDSERLGEVVDLILSNRDLWRCRQVTFQVEPPLVQKRSLYDLPPMPEPELRELVRDDVRRFFRAGDAHLVSDAAWLQADDGTMVARAVAVDVGLVRLLEGAAERVGVRRVRVSPAGEDGTALVLESPERRAERHRRSVWTTVGSGLVATLAWAVALGVHLVDLRMDRSVLDEELARLQAPLASLEVVRAQVRDLRPLMESIETTGARRGWATRMLMMVTEALPPGTYLESMELWADGSGFLVVLGPDPVDVIRRLHDAGCADASLRGEPLSLGPEFGARRRFEVGLKAP